MPTTSKILITGSSGLIGSALLPVLEKDGHEIKKLVRFEPQKSNESKWNPNTGELDPQTLNGATTLIHLAGENIAEGRWTEEKKQRLRDSRINPTQKLYQTILKNGHSIKTVLMASAIGCYGNQGDEILTEESPLGKGFLAQLTQDWEATSKILNDNNIRVVIMRIGIVLSPKGGALSKMLMPFEFGLGGQLGDGSQYMSWITLDDVVNIIKFFLDHNLLSGTFNLVAPNPVTNKVFTKTFGKVLGRPTLFTIPRFAARLAFGEIADEALFSSSRVIPKQLLDSGYKFLFPTLEEGLKNVLKK